MYVCVQVGKWKGDWPGSETLELAATGLLPDNKTKSEPWTQVYKTHAYTYACIDTPEQERMSWYAYCVGFLWLLGATKQKIYIYFAHE